MKPSFALNLSHDGISLLHRAQAGWLCVGDVSLDAPDLVDELVVLRRTATDLEAGGLTTKLVIPDSQVLYVEVDAPGPSRADRIAQIQEALAGLTPYEVRDLVFDWKVRNGKAKVAAVARETLTEAETFATQYRFNPVSFVAIPPKGEFDGEPFFGPTRHAEMLLGEGEIVEPDKRAIEILGLLGEEIAEPEQPETARRKAKPEQAPEQDAADTAPAPGEPEPNAGEPSEVHHDVEAEAEASDPGQPEPEAGTEDQTAADTADSEQGAGAQEPPALPDRRNAAVFGMHGTLAHQAGGDAPLAFASRRARGQAGVNGPAVPAVAPAPVAVERPDSAKVAPLPPVPEAAETGTEAFGDPADKTLPPGAAAARHGGGPSAGRLNGAAAATPLARRPMPPPVERSSDAPKDAAWGKVAKSHGTPSPAARAAAVDPGAPELAGKSDPVLDMARAPEQAKKRKADLPGVLGRIGRGRVETPRQTGTDAPRPAQPTEADTMTVFGARGQTPPRERPRILRVGVTLALLLALAVVALWSTYFMNDVASGWFGLGGDDEIAGPVETAPVIVPEDLALAPGMSQESPVGDTAAGPEQAEAPVAETPPSVPMPGVEVTALQPEEPALPDMPAEAGALDTAPADPVELAAEPAPEPEPEPAPEPESADIEIAAAPPPESEMPETGTSALDDRPPPDIATIAPEMSGTAAPADGGESAAPADGGAAPGEVEIVRLEEPPAAEDAPVAELDAPEPAPTRAPVLDAEEAAAIYARTGISVLAPEAAPSPGADRIDALVLSSADAALADPQTRDLPTADSLLPEASRPAGQFPPLPLTLEFDLDERGLVRPTEDGALTPQGVLVFEGAPSFVPPLRPGDEPAAEEPAAEETPQDETSLDLPAGTDLPAEDTAAAAPAVDETPVDPPVRETPLPDPATLRDLAPFLDETDLAELDERARFGGMTREELAEVRPPTRPGTETAAAPDPEADDAADPQIDVAAAAEPEPDASGGDAEADAPDPLIDFAAVVPPLRPGTEVAREEGVQTASLAADLIDGDTEEAAAPPQTFEGATELAVGASATPPTRPAGFASIVEAALQEAATAPPAPAPETAAPVRTPEVSAPVRAPEIPTTAAVASTATNENALRLNRVNLIGVYGSASNRRALVRLASGRYVKVQTGDEVDGGQVVAIGDAELRYVKRGQTITLTLPSG